MFSSSMEECGHFGSFHAGRSCISAEAALGHISEAAGVLTLWPLQQSSDSARLSLSE